MSKNIIEFDYENRFYGTMHAPNIDINIGSEKGQVAPYDMMYGAISSCLYATFLSITKKMKTSFDSAKMSVSGEKRETVPTTLKKVDIIFTIKNAENKKKIEKAFEYATKYCSVYQTLSHVAEMNYKIVYDKS